MSVSKLPRPRQRANLRPGAYRCAARYGAKFLGGDGLFDMGDTFNPTPVVKTAAEALEFFR